MDRRDGTVLMCTLFTPRFAPAGTPAKTASTPNIDLRGFVARQFFVANLSTFLAYNLQAKKCGGIQKND